MDEVEKYISYYKYLRPVVNQDIRRIGPIQTDGDDAGKPDYFDQEVRTQLVLMGATRSQMDSRKQDPISGRMGEPRPVQESVEQQIERVQKLLESQGYLVKEKDEAYDLRIYKIIVDVSVSKNLGGEIQETQTEIRGIEGVTTVRTLGDTTDIGGSAVAKYEIKFELLGSVGRVKYRDRVLIPGMMKIKGLKILRVSPIHRTNVKGTIRTVREYYSAHGAGLDIGSLGQTAMDSVTPRMTLQGIVDDWQDGGVMAYDVPTNTNDMRYHVMMPVEELRPYVSRVNRDPADRFAAKYKDFIKSGPLQPVYVAIGKNGRVKITGNEDDVWYAVQSGLEELPVFFSYQNQV